MGSVLCVWIAHLAMLRAKTMSETLSVLSQKSLLIIFTYAPAGLGHLRVTDALYHGLPAQTHPILLRSQDASIGFLHHLTSIHPTTRAILEWLQAGKPEELFTRGYRWFLRSRTKSLSAQIGTVLDERMANPDTILVVATHFGLAHQLAAIKTELSRAREITIVLVLQVTDDSPQRIWYVPGADLIVVPSERTKAALMDYGKTAGLPPVRFAVLPYPVSLVLTSALTDQEYEQRHQQFLADGSADIEVAIPISGAAVGLTYFRRLIDELHQKSTRFHFHVIAKSSAYTNPFLQDMQSRSFVTLHTATTDRKIVEKYEQVYQNTVVALEVTKPSEQAFKALVDPHHRGGSVLLFSQPIGRQEHDNLDFLGRHQLLPTQDEQQRLWDSAINGSLIDSEARPALHWRSMRLQDDPILAAHYIWWCLEQGIFAQMLACTLTPQPDDPHANEIEPDGVTQFWQTVSQLLADQAQVVMRDE
jgi:hypothetical protein